MVKSTDTKFKITHVILVFIIIIQSLMMIYVGTQKQEYYIDELYSYVLSNSYDTDRFSHADWIWGAWIDSDVLTEFVTVQQGEKFSYHTVYINNSMDCHPPIYYWVLHTICSFTPDVFSKWQGLSLNIVLFIAVSVFIHLISTKLFNSDIWALLPNILWGFSIFAVDSCMYIRMYMMLTVFSVAFIYAHILMYRKQITMLKLMAIWVLIYIGAMTHYYFLVFSFLGVLLFSIYLLRRKDIKNMLVYGIGSLISVVFMFISYPFVFYQATGSESNNVGTEVTATLLNFNLWIDRTIFLIRKSYLLLTYSYTFSRCVLAFLIVIVLVQVIRKLRKHEVFDLLNIQDGATLSFHHHLRNGDGVMNMFLDELVKRNIKNIHLACSSIFPNNDEHLIPAILNENITKITTNYLNGKVANAIGSGKLKDLLVMETHGGRARSIETGELVIDLAILATPTVDKTGNGTGKVGKNACGVLGYAIPDLHYAKNVVLVSDTKVDKLVDAEFDAKYVDGILMVASIGEASGIVSGTTNITKDPVGLKIARDATRLLKELGVIKDGFSMQTGAGGTSLAVASFVKREMLENNIKGSFASGGITSYFVNMLHEGLFDKLYDVQCFDLDAVKSTSQDANHKLMDASMYGNPYYDGLENGPIVNGLDLVVLGATEIDTNFNVNVTTDSFGKIIGGSGGHSDTANGAKITMITTQLVRSRIPVIKEHVTTISTPGNDIDVLVTERGIAINPNRIDLLEKLKDTKLSIMKIEDLLKLSYGITGVPKKQELGDKVIGVVKYRDGTIIDSIYNLN